jgi:CheY-like chemotaxis protein/two-component sensor histidine kinase
MAEQAAMDAASTVRRLQIYSRPAPDTLDVVDLAELLREVRLILRPLWQDASRASGKEIKVEVAAQSPVRVRASSGELREALTNLVTNAVHALPKGGTIRLGVTESDGEVIVTVADTGTGMPAEIVDHVFEPFFTTKGKGGTGLGLFVTAGIVSHHGGRIRVESEAGKGTTFTLHFPEAGETDNEQNAELPTIPAGLRALLVEDNAPVREATAGMLESAGVHIDTAGNGQAALEALANAHYDLMITDMSMPGMTGVELARAARARCPDMPIVLISGWLGKAQERSDVEADGLISATLNKPLQLPAMLHAISGAVAERTVSA